MIDLEKLELAAIATPLGGHTPVEPLELIELVNELRATRAALQKSMRAIVALDEKAVNPAPVVALVWGRTLS